MRLILDRKTLFFLFIVILFIDIFLLAVCVYPTNILLSLFEPRPGSCLIFEEKYCKKGEPIYYNNHLIGAGYRLPKKAVVFAPFDGEVSTSITANLEKKGEKFQYPGAAVNVFDDIHHIKYNIRAVYYDARSQQLPTYNIKRGEVFAIVSEKTINIFGDYNLILGFSQHDNAIKMLKPSLELNKKYLGI